MITPYLYPDVVYRMTNYFKEVSEASKIVCDFLLKVSFDTDCESEVLNFYNF